MSKPFVPRYNGSELFCCDRNPCFARNKENRHCSVLSEAYPAGKCPFQKEERGVTNGVYYPRRTEAGR